MKEKFYVMIMLCMFISGIARAKTFAVNGITYSILDDGCSVAVVKGSTKYVGDVVIPEEVFYEGLSYAVTTIGKDCFSYSSDLTSVRLPETITEIAEDAFQSCSIESVDMPKSLNSIGSYAFAASALKNVVIPANVHSIGYSAFRSCKSLESVVIEEGVSTIADEAFSLCEKLPSFTIPRSCRILPSGLLYGCKSLREIFIPNTVTKEAIVDTKHVKYAQDAHGCLDNCTGLIKVVFEDGDRPLSGDVGFENAPIEELYWGREMLNLSFRDFTTLEKVTFGDYVKTLPSSCFSGCTGLTEVHIPNGITKIGLYCFNGCSSLKEVYIGDGLEELFGTFGYCKNLEKVYIGNGLRVINYNSFIEDSSLRMICIASNQISTYNTYSTPSIPQTVSVIYVPDKEMCAGVLGAFNLKNIVSDVTGESVYTGKEVGVDMLTSIPDATVTNTSLEGVEVPVNVGSYNTELPVQIAVGEWKSTFKTNCSFTIKPAPLTVIANSLSREYGQDNPEYTCSYVGFVNGENEEVLTAKPSVLCSATRESQAGQYPLIPSSATAQNYDITYERGILTITQAEQQIDWTQDIAKAHVGDIIELKAESSSGLKVTFSSSNPSVADVYSSAGKTYMECVAPGTARITAVQSGNVNYLAADDLVKRVTVEIADGVDSVAEDASIVGYYTLDGVQIERPVKGVNIVRYGNGSVRRVIVK